VLQCIPSACAAGAANLTQSSALQRSAAQRSDSAACTALRALAYLRILLRGVREEARRNRLPNFVPILPARHHVQPVPKTKAVLVLAYCLSTIGTRGEAAEIDRHDVGQATQRQPQPRLQPRSGGETNSTAAKPTQAKLSLSLSAEREPRGSTLPLGCFASQTVRETSESASRCSRIALHSAVIVVVASHVSATCSKFPLVLHPRSIVVAVPVHDCDELLAHILCAPERARLPRHQYCGTTKGKLV
jgi:hypothetical protein